MKSKRTTTRTSAVCTYVVSQRGLWWEKSIRNNFMIWIRTRANWLIMTQTYANLTNEVTHFIAMLRRRSFGWQSATNDDIFLKIAIDSSRIDICIGVPVDRIHFSSLFIEIILEYLYVCPYFGDVFRISSRERIWKTKIHIKHVW